MIAYYTPLKNPGDVMYYHEDRNGNLAQAMDRIWAVFLIETSRNKSVGLDQSPACWRAKNLTTGDGTATTTGGAAGASGTGKSEGVRVGGGVGWGWDGWQCCCWVRFLLCYSQMRCANG